MTAFTSIADVNGEREVVGAVLTIGVKSASLPPGDEKAGKGQAPVYADRFWIVNRFEDERRIRPLLPEFHRFNTAPAPARQVVNGNLVHVTIAEAFHYQLRAQRLPRPEPNPAGHRAACEGDGTRAQRFAGVEGGQQTWREIPCPNRLCAFRQGSPAPCKPFARLYFRPDWSHYQDKTFHGPTPTMKWATGSWNNVEGLVAFFRHVSDQAEQLGIIPRRAAGLPFNPACPVYGLPFSLTLGRRTNPEAKTSYPVVSISPTADLVGFFLLQRQQLEAIGSRALLTAGATSPEEQDHDAIAADYRQISPGVPARSALPVVADGEAGGDQAAELRRARALVDAYAAARRPAVIREAWDVDGWQAVERLPLEQLIAGVKFLRESA